MAYFIFNPQTNELEDSDNPTPIRQNLGQRFLAGGGRVGFQDGTEILPPTQREFPGKKFYQVKDPTYSEGRKRIKTPEYEAWLKTQIRGGETEVVNLYKKLQKLLDRNPTVTEMQSYSKGGHMSLDKIYKYTKKNNLELSQPRKRHGTKAEQEASAIKKRTNILKDTSSTYTERLISGNKKVNLHHMNSKRFNVNLNNLAYVPANVNSGALMKADNTIEGLYDQREKILAERKPGWENKLKDINAKGEKVLNKLPQSARGLINFQIVEAAPSSPNGLKISNKGIDWTLSIGAGEGEMGKINFNELTKDQRNKIVSIAKNKFKYAAPSGAATAAGTAGGMGVALGAVAAGAEHQAGKPWYDVFVNLPIEFASFGMIPATEISQQLRMRGDLKDKGLSLAERNKKMALYNRGKSQEAIDKDEVGLESYALSGLKEGETMNQAKAVRGDEDIELMARKIERGYNPNTGKWESERFVDAVEFAQGGIVPRYEYRDGSMLGDARGWENMLDESDPATMAKLEALKVLQDQTTAEERDKAHENRFLHRSDSYYTDQEESFIPHYVQDVAKTTFGTDAGRKYFGSKVLEGGLEGTQWLLMQIPHMLKEMHYAGLLNPLAYNDLQQKMKDNNFSWMDLLYEPTAGEKLGLNKYQQQKLEELREQAEAEGKPGIPQGVETLGTTGELGAAFADPFLMYGAYRKFAPAFKGTQAKIKGSQIEEQVDMGKRDTLKTLGTGGLMVALAKIFPGIFKGGKAKVASKVAKTNYVKQFGNVQGMPDWFPSFMLKATQKGKLKSLPDSDYIEPMVYELMLPVKIRLGKGKIKTKEVPVIVTQNPRDGTMTVNWTGTDNYGDDIKRSITYKPGETGTQNYAADEYGRGVSKEEVVIQDPEFEYVEPDYSSQGFEDTSPDSASFLDIHDEADEIVEAMEEFVKGADDKFKKKAADEFRLYNQTDEHLGDATGHQTQDGDWVGHEDNMPFPSYDKEVKDVYKPGWNRKKKAMGGVASGPPPLSGPLPQGLPSLQPGDIYNEWIR